MAVGAGTQLRFSCLICREFLPPGREFLCDGCMEKKPEPGPWAAVRKLERELVYGEYAEKIGKPVAELTRADKRAARIVEARRNAPAPTPNRKRRR